MSRLYESLQTPPRSFRDGLSVEPPAQALPRRWGLLALLLLGCLIPRLSMAWRWDILWSDSLFYLELAEGLEKGDFDAGFHGLGLNTFPVILMWLRRTGLDWTAIGEAWSVLMATLAVLPLFGWIRRQFDDRVAFAGCVLYAIHPRLVGFSPLILRDPTYWFLLSLFLYLAWRAVTELRWWLFPATGLVLALVIFTRTEGLLLLVPLLLWTLWRLPAVPRRRAGLVLGTATCLALIPASVLLVNLTWLKDRPDWELGPLQRVKTTWSRVVSSVDGVFTSRAVAGEHRPDAPGPTTAPDRSGAAAHAGASAARKPPTPKTSPQPKKHASSGDSPSLLVFARKTMLRLVKAFTYAYTLLIAVGLFRWRRTFFHRDQQALFLHNALLFLLVWLTYAKGRGIDIRYFLPIVMIGLPYTALGLLQVVEWTVRWAWRYSLGPMHHRGTVLSGLVVAVAAVGVPDVMPSAYPVMAQQAELGRWVLRHGGPNQTVLGPRSCLELVAYYGQARVRWLPRHFQGGDVKVIGRILKRQKPRFVVLWDDVCNPNLFRMRDAIAEECEQAGYRRVPNDRLPPQCSGVLLFVAPEATPKAPETADRKRRSRRR